MRKKCERIQHFINNRKRDTQGKGKKKEREKTLPYIAYEVKKKF
jgi:hypothetical protein